MFINSRLLKHFMRTSELEAAAIVIVLLSAAAFLYILNPEPELQERIPPARPDTKNTPAAADNNQTQEPAAEREFAEQRVLLPENVSEQTDAHRLAIANKDWKACLALDATGRDSCLLDLAAMRAPTNCSLVQGSYQREACMRLEERR